MLEDDWNTKKTHAIIPSIISQPLDLEDIQGEFDAFIEWLSFFEALQSPYLKLIRSIGANPNITTSLFFFHKHMISGDGEFAPPPETELHRIAVAYLRRLLDGSVGDTLSITKEVASTPDMSLEALLSQVNPSRAGSVSCQQRPDTMKL